LSDKNSISFFDRKYIDPLEIGLEFEFSIIIAKNKTAIKLNFISSLE
jgi:hypothetical protein